MHARKLAQAVLSLPLGLSGCSSLFDANATDTQFRAMVIPVFLVIPIALFSICLPAAIFFIRQLVKDKRHQEAMKLKEEIPTLEYNHSYLFALAKYHGDEPGLWKREIIGYFLPIITYVMVTFAGFYTTIALTVLTPVTWAHFDNYLIYGLYAAVETLEPPRAGPLPDQDTSTSSPPASNRSPGVHKIYTKEQIERYGRGTISVIVAAFLGAYLWTLIYLARRVTNFDLSPFSFLRATIQICLACFVCVFLRHLHDSLSQLVWETSSASSQAFTPSTSSWLLALAFMIGFYPALGLNYLQERFAFLRFKTRNPIVSSLSRDMPLEIIDGIDSYIKFRLGEYEIEDIQNLALANPIQLFIETPYPLLEIIDWIGQAQLILEVDNTKINDLRNLSIRTSLDFKHFGSSEKGKDILSRILHPMHSNTGDNTMTLRYEVFNSKLHVQRLIQIEDLLIPTLRGVMESKEPGPSVVPQAVAGHRELTPRRPLRSIDGAGDRKADLVDQAGPQKGPV
jgi:hypothetical protein